MNKRIEDMTDAEFQEALAEHRRTIRKASSVSDDFEPPVFTQTNKGYAMVKDNYLFGIDVATPQENDYSAVVVRDVKSGDMVGSVTMDTANLTMAQLQEKVEQWWHQHHSALLALLAKVNGPVQGVHSTYAWDGGPIEAHVLLPMSRKFLPTVQWAGTESERRRYENYPTLTDEEVKAQISAITAPIPCNKKLLEGLGCKAVPGEPLEVHGAVPETSPTYLQLMHQAAHDEAYTESYSEDRYNYDEDDHLVDDEPAHLLDRLAYMEERENGYIDLASTEHDIDVQIAEANSWVGVLTALLVCVGVVVGCILLGWWFGWLA